MVGQWLVHGALLGATLGAGFGFVLTVWALQPFIMGFGLLFGSALGVLAGMAVGAVTGLVLAALVRTGLLRPIPAHQNRATVVAVVTTAITGFALFIGLGLSLETTEARIVMSAGPPLLGAVAAGWLSRRLLPPWSSSDHDHAG
jgi:hypothetical protein